MCMLKIPSSLKLKQLLGYSISARPTCHSPFRFIVFTNLVVFYFIYLFSHLADAFIQRDLQMRTIEAIKTNKRAITCKCHYKSWLA